MKKLRTYLCQVSHPLGAEFLIFIFAFSVWRGGRAGRRRRFAKLPGPKPHLGSNPCLSGQMSRYLRKDEEGKIIESPKSFFKEWRLTRLSRLCFTTLKFIIKEEAVRSTA